MNVQTGRPGELLPAITQMIEMVKELEADVAKYGDPEWLSRHGPRFATIREANQYYYRDTEAARPFTRVPKGDDIPYKKAAAAFLRLAATCLKIAVDYQYGDAFEQRMFRQFMQSENLVAVGPDGVPELFEEESE